MSKIIIRQRSRLAAGPFLSYGAAAIVADSLSPTSRRVYDCKFRAWCQFADAYEISADDVSYEHMRDFINTANLAKATHQNRLSQTRKVL